MSFAKKVMSFILATGMSVLPVISSVAYATENLYVYDTIIQEKSKDLSEDDEDNDEPFNVFDIYDAYHEIVANSQRPVITSTRTTKATTTNTTVSTTKKTTATAKPTTMTTSKATTKTTSRLTTRTTKAVTSTSTTTTTSETTSTSTSTTTITTATTVTTLPATTVTQAGQFPDGKYTNGIDVSQWQYIIDWQAVKNSGQVDFAIIKAGWGKLYEQVDPLFHQNMQDAQAAGLDVGVYWFSYAMSVEDARQEALVCLETIKDYSFNYPVYFDFEYQWALNNLSSATLSEMIEVFCSTLEEHGYKTGVYGSGSDFEYRIYRHVLDKRPVWVAEYDRPTVTWYKGTHGMWQYTPKGRIDGIQTDVDLNYCYVDYPSIIGVNPVNGSIPAATTPAVPPVSAETTTTQSWNCNIIDLSTTSVDMWKSFDKDTYDFAMIMADSENLGNVGENIDKAHSLGIDCGVIYDCKVTAIDKLKEDIAALDGQLTGRVLEYPLYFNVSAKNSEFENCGFEKNNAAYLASEFCSYFEGKKYFVGIRAEDKALGYRFNYDILSRSDVWQVKYNNDPNLFTGNCGLRSRYNAGTGGFDTVCVTDYPEIIKRIGLNGYTPQPQVVENNDPQAEENQTVNASAQEVK